MDKVKRQGANFLAFRGLLAALKMGCRDASLLSGGHAEAKEHRVIQMPSRGNERFGARSCFPIRTPVPNFFKRFDRVRGERTLLGA